MIDANDNYIEKTEKYAEFLSQPLQLSFFVPCDLDGNVLIEPIEQNSIYWSKEYKESKNRVLFEGFEVVRGNKAVVIVSNGIPIHFCSETKTVRHEKENYSVEDLFKRNDSLGYQIVLTESAKQKIFNT